METDLLTLIITVSELFPEEFIFIIENLVRFLELFNPRLQLVDLGALFILHRLVILHGIFLSVNTRGPWFILDSFDFLSVDDVVAGLDWFILDLWLGDIGGLFLFHPPNAFIFDELTDEVVTSVRTW